MKLNFAGGAYKSFSPNLNSQECVNFYTHIDNQGGVSQYSLRGFPGLKEYLDTGFYAEVRGQKELNEYDYAVVGNKVFRVNKNKVSTECTGTLETSSGKVSMDANMTQICIVDGHGDYLYIVSGTTVTKINLSFTPKTVTERGGYFIVSIDNSGRGYVSDLNDGTSWGATSYFNAEGNPDDTVSAFEYNKNLIMFGKRSIEPYYLSSSTVPFDVYPGNYQEVGIGAKHSPAKLNNLCYFLTNDFQIAEYSGSEPKVISPSSINYQIAQYSKKDDAIGMGINIQGQAFYILTFPSANTTWCYNATTRFFNQLMSYPEPYTNRWRGNCVEFFDNKWIVGDYENGKLYELDFDTFTDNGETIRRTRTLPTIHKDGRSIFHDKLTLFFEMGVGLDGGVQGSNPQAMLEHSDDGGHTWSDEMWESMGEIGEYGDFSYGCQWTRLGESKFRNYRIVISDPVRCHLINADLEADIGVT